MSAPHWIKSAVFYQIFPDRFARGSKSADIGCESWDSPPTVQGFKGGDLYGVIEKLDYLQDLGINAIYFNPIFASASNHRYHTYDYYNVDPMLGGNDALKKLLNAAHKRDMRVMLDGVFNHASRGFWQFHHVLETGESSPYKDWFYFDPDRLKWKKHWGAYPTAHEEKLLRGEDSLTAIGYRAWWNLPALPKFNTQTPAVREFLFGVAEYWIRFGVDGWRLDVPGEIDDDAFWREFRQRVKSVNPQAYIVGEIWHEAQRWLKGDQFDATMNYLLTAGLLGFCGASRLDINEVHRVGAYQGRVHPNLRAEDFARHIDYLLGLYDFNVTKAQFNLLDSHDTPRFLTCVKNNKPALELALLFMFAFPGVPCIYYGDEIGLNGAHDPDCRKSFPWNKLKWDSQLVGYTKKCIALRKSHPALQDGDFHRVFAENGVYAFRRTRGKENLLIALNAAEEPRTMQVDALTKNPRVLFGNPVEMTQQGSRLHLVLNARSGIVIK